MSSSCDAIQRTVCCAGRPEPLLRGHERVRLDVERVKKSSVTSESRRVDPESANWAAFEDVYFAASSQQSSPTRDSRQQSLQTTQEHFTEPKRASAGKDVANRAGAVSQTCSFPITPYPSSSMTCTGHSLVPENTQRGHKNGKAILTLRLQPQNVKKTSTNIS